MEDDRHRIGVAPQVAELVIAVAVVRVDGNQPDLDGGEAGLQIFGAVVEVDRDLVLLDDALVEEELGHPVGTAVEVGPTHVAVALGDGDGVGPDIGHGLPHICVIPVRHPTLLCRVPPAPPRRNLQPTLSGVDLGLPGDDDPRRSDVREWLAAHPKPTGRLLAEAGYVVPHWPAPFGRDADPLTQLVIDDELRAAGVRRPVNPIGIGWAGPTLLYAGTAEQKERWLWPLLAGEEFWCQLFSEPGAGSDLAALRTTAARDGDHYVINGQKVWTSYAHIAQWGILLARTDPTATKHAGISYFVCPMRAPGIEVRALVDMTGEHAFNEVFFTDVRIPADHLVGAENGGWELAKVTLGNERVSLSGEGRAVGDGADGG